MKCVWYWVLFLRRISAGFQDQLNLASMQRLKATVVPESNTLPSTTDGFIPYVDYYDQPRNSADAGTRDSHSRLPNIVVDNMNNYQVWSWEMCGRVSTYGNDPLSPALILLMFLSHYLLQMGGSMYWLLIFHNVHESYIRDTDIYFKNSRSRWFVREVERVKHSFNTLLFAERVCLIYLWIHLKNST